LTASCTQASAPTARGGDAMTDNEFDDFIIDTTIKVLVVILLAFAIWRA
jgi:hypothetical protein